MQQLIVILFLVAGMVLSVFFRKLTPLAAVLGGIIGELLFLSIGWPGIILMAAFFIMGTLASSWKRTVKEKLGVAEANKGKRRARQVIANAGVAGAVALLAFYHPEAARFCALMVAASFSSATADTLSSELGSVYGKKFYNIINLKKEARGLDGVISAEGTLFGLCGSIIIALLFTISFGFSLSFCWIVIAGTAGNIADSILGATLERRRMIKNDGVNFLNTLLAAIVAGLLEALV